MEGKEVGTLFLPAKESLTSSKHWIAYTLRPKGRIFVMRAPGPSFPARTSLLPSGIVPTEGEFGRGDSVQVCGPDGAEFARGLVDYSHRETTELLGHKSGR